MWRFWRSKCDVHTRSSSGVPETTIVSEAIMDGGEYRHSLSSPSPDYILTSCA